METEGRNYQISLPEKGVLTGRRKEEVILDVPFRTAGRFQPELLVIVAPSDLQVLSLLVGQYRCDLRERWKSEIKERWTAQKRRGYVIEFDGKVGGAIITSPLSVILRIKFGAWSGQFTGLVFGKWM